MAVSTSSSGKNPVAFDSDSVSVLMARRKILTRSLPRSLSLSHKKSDHTDWHLGMTILRLETFANI